MNRILTTIFLLISTHIVLANPVDIGRTTVTLPNNGEWTQFDGYDGKVEFTGTGLGRSEGNLPDETKSFALILPTKRWGAVFIMTASKGGSPVEMHWNNSCAPVNKEKVIDLSGGGFKQRNCIRIWENINTENLFADKDYEKAKTFFESKAITLTGGAYSVTHFFASITGAYIIADVLISDEMLGKLSEEYQGNIGKTLEAWAKKLAKENSGSASSIFGRVYVPSLE
jgi:hypothetical protein